MTMKRLRLFRKDEGGSVPIEGVMGALLLLGWYAIAYQFYDAFRSKALAMRASYTVADMISREKTPIGPTYLAGAKKMFDYIMVNNNPAKSWIRTTIIFCKDESDNDDVCDGTDKPFSIATDNGSDTLSSHGTNGVSAHTAETINQAASMIPEMAEGDYAVVLETSIFYNPIFDIGDKQLSLDGGSTWTRIGLSSQVRFSNFIVTRPRGPRTVWDSSN